MAACCCPPNLPDGLHAACCDMQVCGMNAHVIPRLVDWSAVCEMHHKVDDGGGRRTVAMNGRRRVISTMAGR